jgi:integrase
MGITNDRGRFYFVKRVPRRFQHIDPRSQVRVALHTDSREEARRKAPQVEAGLLAYWEALAAGNGDDAAAQYRAARALAAARGFTYRPQADLLIPTAIDDLLARLSALARPGGAVAPYEDAAALLGVVEAPRPAFSAVLTEFLDLTTDRLVGKSPAQVRRWRLPREKAVRNFIEAVGDKPIDEIGRQDALTFRRWWRDRVEANGLNPHTANKDFGRLADVFGTWAELQGRQLDNPFRSLRFKEQGAREAHPFSVDWIRGRLLAPGALDGLGAEARDVLLVMVNTGARPSEVIDALAEDFAISDPVPHFQVRAREDRTLKTDHSRRDIPLLGVSLDAARRLAEAGGPVHYRGRNDVWSATVNKFLTTNGLRETPRHTAYSLRHSFEDRLLDAGVDDRLRADLMGHKYGRPAYGKGGALETKRDAVARIAV